MELLIHNQSNFLKKTGKKILKRLPVIGKVIKERDLLRIQIENLNKKLDANVIGTPSLADRTLYPNFLNNKPKIAYHGNTLRWLSTFANKKECKVLEIGSRAVCSDSVWKSYIPNCNYTGFDVMEGKNVNFVGDAHKLSDYFEQEYFDIVVSHAVFEHLAMPWIVAEEIAKVLKIGGFACIETHFSFSEHELPCHFFQFNKRGLECLFNNGMGFEIIDSGMDNPMIGRFSIDASDYLVGQPIGSLYCHSSIIAKKIEKINFVSKGDHWRKSLDKFTENLNYPKNTEIM